MQNFEKPIVLIGMMGSGKSALAQMCADIMDLEHFDSDLEIEKRAGKAIKDIFAEEGEAAFRAIEKEIVLELLDKSGCFVATGGGVVLDEEVRLALKMKALTIWLDVPVDELYERVKEDGNRPLLQTDDPIQALRDLMDARRDYYAKADLHLKISNEGLPETAQRLLKDIALYNYS